ncbi:MAG: ribosome biogenesis factor YjgA [Rhodocyclaceae bacterium]|nr:ribosome biogenesis factor YjgA [Rhodocyclaceae bacterium]
MSGHHHEESEEDQSVYDGPSKSQKKRDMDALQKLGKELTALPPARLKKIAMPEALLDAILEWQHIPKHEAQRRQLQYIGRIMRHVDPAPLKEALDAIKGVSAAEKARMDRLERLRVRLLEDESVLGEIAEEHPEADLQHLRQLRRNALKEAEHQKPPRAFREIFRVLRDLQESGIGDQESEDTDQEPA